MKERQVTHREECVRQVMPNSLLGRKHCAAMRMAMAAFVLVWCGNLNCRTPEVQLQPDRDNISNNPGASAGASIVVDQNCDAYVAWLDSSPGKYVVMFSEKRFGRGWSSPISVSRPNRAAYASDLCLDNAGNLHIVWWEAFEVPVHGIYCRMRTAAGVWQNAELVSKPDTSGDLPNVAADSRGNIYVFWLGGLGADLTWYRKKDPSGVWDTICRIHNTSAWNPARIAADGDGNVHVAWPNAANYDIWYCRKTADDTCVEYANLTSSIPSLCGSPDIAVDAGDQPHVVFTTFGGLFKAYYTTKVGGNWGGLEEVPTADAKDNPSVLVDGNGIVHLAWQNFAQAESTPEVYYISRTQDGKWSHTVNISETPGQSRICQKGFAIDRLGYLHFLWADNTWGEYDILYRRIKADSLR